MTSLSAVQSDDAQSSESQNLSTLPPFEMCFSLYLECEACVKAVRNAVEAVPGISSAEPSLASQTLTTLGTAAPSSVLAAIQSTGRDAVVRGTGVKNDVNGGSTTHAAVAILEDYDTDDYSGSPVKGLARIVQVAFPPKDVSALSVVDISVSGLSEGVYVASIRRNGDISMGSRSVGKAWRELPGRIVVGKDGIGGAVVVGRGWEVWEIVGRAFAVKRVASGSAADDGDTGCRMVLGVIARSAGVWDNDKMVCSCSGKTVWEERVEQKGRGML